MRFTRKMRHTTKDDKKYVFNREVIFEKSLDFSVKKGQKTVV